MPPANHVHAHVLCGLAANTALPSELADRLIEVAGADADFVDDLVGREDPTHADPDAKALKSVAPHPGLSEPQLLAMVDRHGVRILAKVATDPDASGALLEDLTRHRPPVQKAFRGVARHPRVTPQALLACLTDLQARPIAAVW